MYPFSHNVKCTDTEKDVQRQITFADQQKEKEKKRRKTKPEKTWN